MNPDEQDLPDVTIRHARLDDAAGIAAVHVTVWRTAYPGVLPEHTLTGLSRQSLAYRYASMIGGGAGVLVARAPGAGREQPGVVGFTSASRSRTGIVGLAEGEVETLYVLDDWRDQGIGRSLLQAAARHLAGLSCRSMFLWVLADNPSRWFYERLGGRAAMHSTTRVGGQTLPQIAMVWDRIEVLSNPS
ncbi:MAG: GNAT family N-acetyltransferase [Janthinobacterium lividum]